MIIFKLISAGFKQNLGTGGSKFYLRGSKKLLIYIYIYNLARSGGSFEPPSLKGNASPD